MTFLTANLDADDSRSRVVLVTPSPGRRSEHSVLFIFGGEEKWGSQEMCGSPLMGPVATCSKAGNAIVCLLRLFGNGATSTTLGQVGQQSHSR